jgi:DNA repair photolyase
MKYQEINASSIIKEITFKDNLFNGNYTIDPYQNCEIGCTYCDSSYDDKICVKINANEILKNEIKKITPGRIIIGSVNDPYQPAEEKYEITKELINTIKKENMKIHILTKSNTILRDLELLKTIKDVIVTFTLISLDKKISKIFEPNATTPINRLKTMKKLSENGIKSGIALIPIIPYINDNNFSKLISVAKIYNAEYFLYKHLELKGDQKLIVFNLIKKHFPDFLPKYEKIYKDSYKPNEKYLKEISKRLINESNRIKIPLKIK